MKAEIFGLLGPNGAGKTTTIRMLTMLTKPTAGEILYKGKDIFSDELNVKKIYRCSTATYKFRSGFDCLGKYGITWKIASHSQK